MATCAGFDGVSGPVEFQKPLWDSSKFKTSGCSIPPDPCWRGRAQSKSCSVGCEDPLDRPNIRQSQQNCGIDSRSRVVFIPHWFEHVFAWCSMLVWLLKLLQRKKVISLLPVLTLVHIGSMPPYLLFAFTDQHMSLWIRSV